MNDKEQKLIKKLSFFKKLLIMYILFLHGLVLYYSPYVQMADSEEGSFIMIDLPFTKKE